jgi:hypothetical protein
VSFVCQSGAYLAGGESPSAVEGTPVGICSLEDLAAKSKGRTMMFQKVQGVFSKLILILLCISAETCKLI